ncbi:MAG: alpha/beta hydrolase [Lysobacterales bacterium]
MRIRTVIFGITICIIGLAWWVIPVFRSGVEYLGWKAFSAPAISSGFAQNGEVRIHYSIYGDGPPLVLLHGGLSSSLDWIGEIPELSRHYKVIAIDLRGHGLSSPGANPFTYRQFAQDVLAVLDSLSIASADIAGWSDGGNVGLLFALQFPERIGHLIAISANFNPGGILSEFRNNVPAETDSWIRRWLHRITTGAPSLWPQHLKRVTQMWQHFPQLTTEDLNRIRTPTLVVVGEHDYVKLAHARAMADALPDGQLLVLSNVGHSIPRDAPDRLLKSMEQFLEDGAG